MKRLGSLGFLIGCLALGTSRPASANAILNLTVGANTVTCDTGVAFSATNCNTADGYINPTAGADFVSFSRGLGGPLTRFFGYQIPNAFTFGSQDALGAIVSDSKTSVKNFTATADLIVFFGVYGLTLPVGPDMVFSASQGANWTSSLNTDTSSYTGYVRADNGTTAGGDVASTPLITSPGGNTQSFGLQSGDFLFTRNGVNPFSLLGVETIHLGVGDTGSFSATSTVEATPEPGTLVLLGSALLGIGAVARRRFARQG